jgi:hypothetical protein
LFGRRLANPLNFIDDDLQFRKHVLAKVEVGLRVDQASLIGEVLRIVHILGHVFQMSQQLSYQCTMQLHSNYFIIFIAIIIDPP